MEDKRMLNDEELENVNGGVGYDNEQLDTVDGEAYINGIEPAESFEITL
ncbi:MAG: hypothetical protein MJ147_06585 [Clostridia bacterium]|nr:hypothetical protein [Clostridia bacterium]